jgi:hypothetical protein
MIGTTLLKHIPAAVLLCIAASSVLSAEPIDFTFDDPISADLSGIMDPSAGFVPIDRDRYKNLGAGYWIQDLPIITSGGAKFRLILMCGSVSESGRASAIQLVLVDERPPGAKVMQRVRLGSGEAPQLTSPAPGARDVMFRVIRTGNISEGSIYSIDPGTGRLKESMRIDGSFLRRAKLDVKGTLMPDARVEVVSKLPEERATVDLSEAMDALVEDGIYQQNGRPVPALANLTLARGGWEDEGIYHDEGGVRLEVGLSLVTNSKKQVVDVMATLAKDDAGEWVVTDLNFEPFLPYR